MHKRHKLKRCCCQDEPTSKYVTLQINRRTFWLLIIFYIFSTRIELKVKSHNFSIHRKFHLFLNQQIPLPWKMKNNFHDFDRIKRYLDMAIKNRIYCWHDFHPKKEFSFTLRKLFSLHSRSLELYCLQKKCQ